MKMACETEHPNCSGKMSITQQAPGPVGRRCTKRNLLVYPPSDERGCSVVQTTPPITQSKINTEQAKLSDKKKRGEPSMWNVDQNM